MFEDALVIELPEEEWAQYPKEKRKEVLNKLGTIDHYIAQHLYACLLDYESVLEKDEAFDLEKTYEHIYGKDTE